MIFCDGGACLGFWGRGDWHADVTGPLRRSADDFGFFRNTDWSNLKNLFYTIVFLSELVLSFVEMKANENVFTQSCTEVFLKGIGLNRVTQSALRFFCFRFQVSSF